MQHIPNEKKDVFVSDEAVDGLILGINTLADAVKITLGPQGKNVIIQKDDENPLITKDGVTVAHNIVLYDHLEKLGSDIVKQAALKTAMECGDGTTTSIVLSQKLINSARTMTKMGYTARGLSKGIELGKDIMLNLLKEKATSISEDSEQLENIAAISANNDTELGKLIAEAYRKVGIDGVVAVQGSNTNETTISEVKGMEFDNGYLSPYFMTDPKSYTAEYEDCYILVHDGKIRNHGQLVNILSKVSQKQIPLLIIADEIDAQTMNFLVLNKTRAGLKVIVVKSPGFSSRKKLLLQDIAILTGATVITEDFGLTLDKVDIPHLGKAKRVKVTAKSTLLVDGQGDPEKINERVEILKGQMSEQDNQYQIDKLKERIAKLSSGVSIIKVGGQTDAEMKQRKDRVEDAVYAVRAAVQTGVLPGGGTALAKLAFEVETANPIEGLNASEVRGLSILLDACKEPVRVISDNSGMNKDIILDRILSSEEFNIGYNALTNEYEDLLHNGVIDPTKVVTAALEAAVSVATLIINTGAAVLLNKIPFDRKGFDTDMMNDV